MSKHVSRRYGGISKYRTVMVRTVAVVLAGLSPAALATPPANLTPDPSISAWFKSLRQPGTQHLCCSVSDCRVMPSDIRNGHYEVKIDDWPYVVPESAILYRADNPTGKAVVCYGYSSFGFPTEAGQTRTAPQDPVEILCFIPPKQITSSVDVRHVRPISRHAWPL